MDSKTSDQVLEGESPAGNDRVKTIDANCEILAEAILKTIETAKVYSWYEWDVFAGRQVYKTTNLRDEQKKAVVALIKHVVER